MISKEHDMHTFISTETDILIHTMTSQKKTYSLVSSKPDTVVLVERGTHIVISTDPHMHAVMSAKHDTSIVIVVVSDMNSTWQTWSILVYLRYQQNLVQLN